MMRKLTKQQQFQKNIIDYHQGSIGKDVFMPEKERTKSAWDYIPRTDDSRPISEKQQEIFEWYED